MFWFDPSWWIFIGPAMLLSIYASIKVRTAYSRYSRVRASSGMSGAQAARRILDMFGASDVRIEPVGGNLTDHYDPRSKTLRLSGGVYSDDSLAAVGVAAHEAGHALQHAQGYAPLALRSALVPAASLGSNLGIYLVIFGLILRGLGGLSVLMMQVGIVLFAAAVAFTLITLPVELNASKRAMQLLTTSGVITSAEYQPVRKVLNAAALTYVAAAITAVMQLIYLISLSERRR